MPASDTQARRPPPRLLTKAVGHLRSIHTDVPEGAGGGGDNDGRSAFHISGRTSVAPGLRHIARDELTTAEAARRMLHIRVPGLVAIARDATPERARGNLTDLRGTDAPRAALRFFLEHALA